MKKSVAFVLIGLIFLLVTSCSVVAPKAYVRFQNSTDFNIYYGIKFGDAEYVGPVSSGYITGYIATDEGTYSLQAMNSSGQWITISTGSLSVYSKHKYTIVGTGTGGSYIWGVVQDE